MWIVIIAVAVFCLALTVPCLVLSDFVSKNKNKGLKRINAVKYSCFVACCFVDVFGCRCVYTRLNKYAYSEFCYFSFMQRTDYVFVFRRVFVFDGRIRTSVP